GSGRGPWRTSPEQGPLVRALQCVLQIARPPVLVRRVLAKLSNRRGTDPYARWCGRGGAVRRPPIPINPSSSESLSLRPRSAASALARLVQIATAVIVQTWATIVLADEMLSACIY